MNYITAINSAMNIAMDKDEKVICYGLGVNDPKTIFETTKNLKEKFGDERVFDVPTSENALMGIGTGLAIGGYRPIFVNQRLDFILLAMDQIVNASAKWFYMFGSKRSIPLVVRLIVGRGWGQGPTHSQCLHSWFSHIPGLKVIMPSNPYDAKGLLLSSIFDNNPVIFIEHRWLHNMKGDFPEGDYRIPIGKAKIIKPGNDITIVSNSYMTVEAIHAANHLSKQNISAELIDLRSIRPLDWETIINSVKKTGNLIVLDTGSHNISIASEIISGVTDKCWQYLKNKPYKIGMPDHAEPTSFGLTKDFYPNATSILKVVSEIFNKEIEWSSLEKKQTWPHDIPGDWFKGPF